MTEQPLKFEMREIFASEKWDEWGKCFRLDMSNPYEPSISVDADGLDRWKAKYLTSEQVEMTETTDKLKALKKKTTDDINASLARFHKEVVKLTGTGNRGVKYVVGVEQANREWLECVTGEPPKVLDTVLLNDGPAVVDISMTLTL
jgi:hypothetical protein